MAHRCRVLLVEDDCATREQLSEVLRLWGYTVDTAADGEEALNLVQRNPPPHVLLVDLLMPRLSGWELIAEIKKNERLSRIPLVVVSGCSQDERLLPPADAHLGKPLDLGRLHELLGRLC
ncbi:MAG TPA: response regulator [Gammaproteobacteria bacterium]